MVTRRKNISKFRIFSPGRFDRKKKKKKTQRVVLIFNREYEEYRFARQQQPAPVIYDNHRYIFFTRIRVYCFRPAVKSRLVYTSAERYRI